MSFESTYQLVAPIADSAEALSYKAVIKMTGEEVWIHIVRTDAHEVLAMAKKQYATASFGEKPILEVVQEGAKSYIVTRPLPAGASLRDWLLTLGQARTPDPLQKAGAFKLESYATPAPAAVTQELPSYTLPPPPVAPLPPPVAAAPLAPQAPVFAAPPPPPVQEPGEFTRMFKAQPAAPQAPVAQQPDAFSSMFQAPPTSAAATPTAISSTAQMPAFAAPPPKAPTPASQESSEFDRMFQSPLMQHTPAPINPITNPIAPPPSQQAGEFTRMFKAVEPSSILPTSAPPPPPPPPKSAPGDFTRMLQVPSMGGGQAAPSASTPPFGAPAQPPPFGAPAQPPPYGAPAQPPPYGAPAQPPPFGAPAQPAPFGAPAQPPPYGAPAQAKSYQSPAQQPPPAQASPSSPSSSSSSHGFNKPAISGPTFSAPSVNMSGMSGPSISSSGEISAGRMPTPSFHQGNVYGPSMSNMSPSLGGGSFSLDNLPGFGSGSAPAADPGVAPPAAGPLSSSSAPMNPNALSTGDGATGFFRAPAPPAQPMGAAPPVQSGPGEFTRMMKAPPVASAPAVGVPVPQSNAPAASHAPLFSQAAPPQGQSAAPPAAAAPAPAPAPALGFLKGMSIWMIIGNVVIVLMVIVLIYVIMKSSR